MTKMALFIGALFFILSANGRDSGEYFSHYNQSTFTWGPYWGATKGYCTLTARYESGGRPYSDTGYDWDGCKKTELSYESQQEFDLAYWELLKVCPFLLKTPPAFRGTVDYTKPEKGKGAYLLPDKLVWSTQCRTTSNNPPWGNSFDQDGLLYCPRWQCDNRTTTPEWDSTLNDSVTYYEITSLSFSSIPIETTCWKCGCEYWPNGDDWVWTCQTNNNAGASFGGQGWGGNSINPIEDEFEYSVKKCQRPTDNPTQMPTDSPVPEPTTTPTDSPLTVNCPTVWNAVFQQPNVRPGDYYWDTPAIDNCGTISFCKCTDDGTGYCKSTYADIMADDELYTAFINKCGGIDQNIGSNFDNGGYLAECWTPDKADQLFQYYNYANEPAINCNFGLQYFCPRCGCTTTQFVQSPLTNGTSNITVYAGVENDTVSRADYVYTYDCTNCDCVFDNTLRGWASYYQCGMYSPYDATNNNEPYTGDLNLDCTYRMRKCFYNYGEYDSEGKTSPQGTYGYTRCSDQRTSSDDFENYCSFVRIELDESSGDNICVEDNQEQTGYWGCGDSWRCDLLGEPGTYCADYNYQVTQYDCINDEWIGDTYKANMRYSCCNDGWMCNNRTTDEYLDDTCTKSDEMSEYQTFTSSCEYSQMNLYDLTSDVNLIRAAFCGDRLDYNEYEVDEDNEDGSAYCELLKVYWQYNTFCSCNRQRMLIKYLNDATDPPKDSGLMVNYFKRDFWNGDDMHGEGLKTLRQRMIQMAAHWDCDTKITDYAADTFFTCDFDADVDEISNKNVKDADAANNLFSYWHYIIVLISVLFNTKDNRSMVLLVFIGLFMYVNADPRYDFDNSLQTGSDYDKCEFIGDISTSNSEICEQITYEKSVFQNEDLTWDVLVEACPYLEVAGCWTKDKQISMDKLVWPNQDHECNSCPQCPCSNETDTMRHYVKDYYNLKPSQNMISEACFLCNCDWNTDAEEYSWDCNYQRSQSPPYTTNDTEFCPGTDAPTSAPTAPLELYCMDGGNYPNLSPDGGTSMYGPNGVSHCGWRNVTRERYPNAEPAVCVVDELDNNYIRPGYFSSGNTDGVCNLLFGSKMGCYYSNFDMKVEEWDCARDKWITDTYMIKYTLYCCNDGYYCNNQSMINTGIAGEVSYYSYENLTETITCESSSKLKEYWEATSGCSFRKPRLDDNYIRKMECHSPEGSTDSKPTCEDLEKYWKYYSRCQCSKAKYIRDHVNATYQEYIEDYFELWAGTTADNLIKWADILNCGWKPGTKWFCSGGNMHFVSITAAIFIAVLSLFV